MEFSRPVTPTTPAIVWFRRDLRTGDNPALSAAVESGRPVIPVYIHDPAGPPRALGGASAWWLDKSLAHLADDLAALGSPLILRRGDAATVLRALIAETGGTAVYWNRLYDSVTVTRDAVLKSELTGAGLDVRSFNGALLNEPWETATQAGAPYRVFTAYWRAARVSAGAVSPLPAPKRLLAPTHPPLSDRLSDWDLHPSRPDWSGGFGDWSPGEAGARTCLDAFLDNPARLYGEQRNRPDLEGTSRISPHLHFGEISPRQVWAATDAAAHVGSVPLGQIEVFQKELGWREFNHHLLSHFPGITTENLNAAFDRFPWRDDPVGLAAWRAGRTGYPIVDAGMRQLWSTGWMHNRVRMIVASFLVKDLLIDWRTGEAWFWNTLVDADVANNAANWQWVAGCGADAAPYFRVFNPTLQGEKFDPSGAYVRRWVPELARLSDADIHQPWRAARPPAAYPAPIVDHAKARNRALEAYRRTKS